MSVFLLVDVNSIARTLFEGDRTLVPTRTLQCIVEAQLEAGAEKVVACFDGKYAREHRQAIWPDYKSKRPPAEEGFRTVLEDTYRGIKRRNWPIECEETYEADDLVASLVCQLPETDRIFMYTNDSDLDTMLQGDRVIRLYYVDGLWRRRTQADLEKKVGLPIEKYTEYRVLLGKTGDGVPGVKGVGEKTAQELLTRFHTVQEIVNNLESIKLRKNQRASFDALIGTEDLRKMREVLQLRTDAKVSPGHVDQSLRELQDEVFSEWDKMDTEQW